MILACIYYPLGFAFFNKIKIKEIFKKSSYSDLSALRVLGAIGAGTALSTICVGILFKLQRWPGSDINLLAGLILSLIVLIIAIIRFVKSKDLFYRQIFIRFSIIGIFGVLMYFTSTLSLVKIQYRQYPDYIKAYEEYSKNPTNIELQKKVDYEFNRATMSPKEFEYYESKINEE
jgi:uncharacterized membrane protein